MFGQYRPIEKSFHIDGASLLQRHSWLVRVIYRVMAESKPQKVQDVATRLSKERGNGILRREVLVDSKGKVVRYDLAYINHDISQSDNGRALGYDNAHGVHHRHYKGKVKAVEFQSFGTIEERFEAEWLTLSRKGKK